MLYPLRFQPIYKSAIWGGGHFADFFGRDLYELVDVAESWEVSGHPAGISVVANGPLAGLTMTQLMEKYRKELLGIHAKQKRFPLLIKFLDANRQLSVQVHPNRSYVRKHQFPDGEKAEAWVILRAEPGSKMVLGFQKPVTRNAVRLAIQEERLNELLFEVTPKVGECYFLPPGTVHSLGAGILLYEVQQCSNLTFRLYDWNRTDAYGNRRELHVEHGVQSISPKHWSSAPTPPRSKQAGLETLLETDYFWLNRWTLTARGTAFPHECQLGGDARCHVLTVLEGEVCVSGLEGLLVKGDTVVLPAQLPPSTVKAVRKSVFLDAFLP